MVAVAAVISLLALDHATDLGFNHDLLSLLPDDSEAARYQRRMTAESDFNAEMVIFTAPDLATARHMEAQARALPAIARVQGPSALMPADAEARAARARSLAPQAAALPDALRDRILSFGEALTAAHLQQIAALARRARPLAQDAHLAAALADLAAALDQPNALARTQALVFATAARAHREARRLQGWAQAAPLTVAELPASVRDRMFAADGTVALYAAPRASVYQPEALAELVDQAYSVSPEATGFPTTHRVFSSMVVEDFIRGSLLAFAVALGWIALSLRRPRLILLAALPLAVGGLWTLGVMGFFGLRFDFANVVALPLVMGLAVDYGVWLAHSISDHPSASPWWSACTRSRKAPELWRDRDAVRLGHEGGARERPRHVEVRDHLLVVGRRVRERK